MTLGERIQDLRKKNGYSQEKLSSKLNVSRQAVQKWEQNICEPSMESLTMLAGLFNVSLDYLLLGKEKEEREKTESKNTLTKTDIVLLITFLLSVALFIGLFIYSLLNPMVYNQTKSFIWWYVRIWVSTGTLFRLLVLLSVVGIVTSLILFLKKRKTK